MSISEAALVDLRRRIAATRWPEKETVSDRSQGVQLARLQALVGYWGTKYDWRKAEAKLNALPQFVTTIDGLDIHFIQVRSRHPNALPLVITHGWPGSVFEQIKLIGPLTDPTAYGGSAEDAFDVVIPSMPGYGFSGKPTRTGWGPDRIARAWDVLMKRSARLYWENNNNNFNAVDQKTADIKIPVAISVFPGEIYQAPRSWAERAYPNLLYFHEVDKGGHFAAWEEPELFAAELRAAFRSLRGAR